MITIGKITKDQILKHERKVRRDEDIEQGFKPTGNRVHRSKKSYNRKENKNFNGLV